MHRLRVHWLPVLSLEVGMLCQVWLWLQRAMYLNLCNQVLVMLYQLFLLLLCHLLKRVMCHRMKLNLL